MARGEPFDSKSFHRSIAALGRAARYQSEYSIRQANLLLKAAVWKECPVDTGKLRESIRVEPMLRGPLGISQEVTVGRADERGIVSYVHDGTKFMKANPFFDRAVVATEGRRQSLIVRGMGLVIRLGAK